MIHLYTSRQYPRYPQRVSELTPIRYKRFCDKARIDQVHEEGFTSVHHKVTCPDCLQKLIPDHEAKLIMMKTALEKAKHDRSAELRRNQT